MLVDIMDREALQDGFCESDEKDIWKILGIKGHILRKARRLPQA